MSIMPNYVPREYKTFNIMLMVKDAHRALKFYNNAFGAEITMQLESPEGKIVHAEMKIEDTIIMIGEDDSAASGSGIVIQFYTGDANGLFDSAIMAGAKEVFPVQERFYGDRAGRVVDPFGHHWIIATALETLPSKELQRRFNELYS
jgi:PhnB protein